MAEETEGLRIARARIAKEAEEQTGFLDLGELGLTELPEELFELKGLRRLLLGNEMGDEVRGFVAAESEIDINDLNADFWRLRELSKLETLSVAGLFLRDLSPLASLASLQSLDCHDTYVTDLSPLVRIDALQSLDCGNTGVADLSPLNGLDALKSLDCSDTQVANLSPLAGIISLQSLYCSLTPIADLAPLAGLTVLQSLGCSLTEVSDLSPLARLNTLQSFCCSDTPVSDLSPLANLPKLRDLNFSGCQLSRIPEGFWDKPSLKTLNLYEAILPSIPAEVLSKNYRDNCLYRLRAHLQDLKSGEAAVDDVKLMVLGNGRAGKTQICRRLKGEEYDEQIPSTHGIEVSSHPVGALFKRDPRRQSRLDDASAEPSRLQSAPTQEPSRLETAPTTDESRLESAPSGEWKIWDFGGQDIYHGTHALFLKTRAVFVLVWATETEYAGEHEQDGMIFRNYPLAYWLDYVRHLAGTDSPIIIVQTRCDRPEDDAVRPPLDEAALADFPFRKVLHFSAKENRVRAALDEALAEAAAWLRERNGVNPIGIGRLNVQRRLEALREDIPHNPQYRTITQDHFRELCAEAGGVSAPEHLLDYLHNTGAVFYRPGLFQDAIVLDQGWALEAIYAVFHRGKSYKPLRQLGGRFTRSLLEALVWQEFNPDEQALFLDMMQSCGVCFVHRRGDKETDIETEYIAPDLLPLRPAVAGHLAWDEDTLAETTEFGYPLYHPGLLRGLMADIGGEAGINAEYWQGGFAFYEQTSRSHVLVEQVAGEGWSGSIRFRIFGGQAAELRQRLVERMRRVHDYWGLRAVENVAIHVRPARLVIQGGSFTLQEGASAALSFGPDPSTGREIYISYAWADDTPAGQVRGEIVERFCAAAERRGIKIIRDRDAMQMGDSIMRFMQQLGAGKRVLVILSDKYLKSPFCMYELFEIWRINRMDKTEFKRRAGVYRLDCAKIIDLSDRLDYSLFWREKFRQVDEKIQLPGGAASMGVEGFLEYKRMQDFAHHIGDILDFFKDTLHPGNFEELERHELGDEVMPLA